MNASETLVETAHVGTQSALSTAAVSQDSSFLTITTV